MAKEWMKDRVVVVIGGTGGLGLAASLALVRSGARLVVVGKDETGARTARKALGGRARVMVAEATEPTTAERAIRLALRVFGGVHGLYHVAGGSGRRLGDAPLHEMTDRGWKRTMDLNLSSVVYSNRAAIRQFLKQGKGGVILNLASVLAWSPSPVHFATHAYAAAKAGIIGITLSTASYYAPRGIRANVLAPGLVETPMAQRAVGNPAIQTFIRSKQPLEGGRIGQPGDLDAAVVYFLSEQSRFVTGQVLAVDGGWSVTEGVERTGIRT